MTIGNPGKPGKVGKLPEDDVHGSVKPFGNPLANCAVVRPAPPALVDWPVVCVSQYEEETMPGPETEQTAQIFGTSVTLF